jgi:hypothetical protein
MKWAYGCHRAITRLNIEKSESMPTIVYDHSTLTEQLRGSDAHCLVRSTQGVGHSQTLSRPQSRHAAVVTYRLFGKINLLKELSVRAAKALALHGLLLPVAQSAQSEGP